MYCRVNNEAHMVRSVGHSKYPRWVAEGRFAADLTLSGMLFFEIGESCGATSRGVQGGDCSQTQTSYMRLTALQMSDRCVPQVVRRAAGNLRHSISGLWA